MPSYTTVILLAAYNGERYIGDQVRSILESKQTGCSVEILISDDSPGRATERALQPLRREHITYSRDINIYPGGYQANFSALCAYAMQKTHADFYCLCDQDDIWHPEKLELLLGSLDKTDPGRPQLAHSDLEVVNEKLDHIAPSFIKYQDLPPPDSHPFSELLHLNTVTGCATMFNRRLLELATPIPRSAVAHDHWLALCAEYLGTLVFNEQALVKYRQHGENAIGALSLRDQMSPFKPHFYRIVWRFPKHLAQAIEQARALEHRRIQHGIEVNPEKRSVLSVFCNLKSASLRERIGAVSRFFKRRKKLHERAYLIVVLALLPYIKSREFEPES